MFAVEQGFKNIFLMPDSRHPWSEQEIQILEEELDKIFLYINLNFKNNVEPIKFSPMERMLKDLISFAKENKEINISRNCMRCGLGTLSGSIGYDGSIYGCQEQPSKDITNIFYIGHLENGINKELHINLLKEYNKKEIAVCVDETMCKKCSLRTICFGWSCPSSSWDLYNNFRIDSVVNCRWREKLMANSMILFTNLKDNLIFK